MGLLLWHKAGPGYYSQCLDSPVTTHPSTPPHLPTTSPYIHTSHDLFKLASQKPVVNQSNYFTGG